MDFEAEIRNGLGSLRTVAASVGDAFEGLRYKMSKAAEEGGREFKKFAKSFDELGMGGKMAGKLTEMFGEGGHIHKGAIAFAAVAAAVAITAKGIEIAEERAKALAEALGKVREASFKAAEAGRSRAGGAESIGRNTAKAENLFGSSAGETASGLAEEFGVSQEDVISGMAGAGRIPRAARQQAIYAAVQAASSGQMTVTEGIAALSDPKNRFVMGQKYSGAALLSVSQGLNYNEALNMIGDRQGAAGGQLGAVNRAGNILTSKQSEDFTSGRTADVKERRSLDEANPMIAMARELERAHDEQIKMLADEIAQRKTLKERLGHAISAALHFGTTSDASKRKDIDRSYQTVNDDQVWGTSGD